MLTYNFFKNVTLEYYLTVYASLNYLENKLLINNTYSITENGKQNISKDIQQFKIDLFSSR